MLSFAGTYPEDSAYWVADDEINQYPSRYGDVFATPQGLPQCTEGDISWHAIMALHPSCELGVKGAPGGVQVVRVRPLHSVADSQAQQIRVGLKETGGRLQVAFAHTAYLAPLPGTDVELFADFREAARVGLKEVLDAGRLGAMSHDARVALLRRDLYFRYRWLLTLDDVVALESSRIANDPNYAGPLPTWVD